MIDETEDAIERKLLAIIKSPEREDDFADKDLSIPADNSSDEEVAAFLEAVGVDLDQLERNRLAHLKVLREALANGVDRLVIESPAPEPAMFLAQHVENGIRFAAGLLDRLRQALVVPPSFDTGAVAAGAGGHARRLEQIEVFKDRCYACPA